MLLIGIVAFLVVRLHRQWDGAITVDQAENAKLEPSPSLLREGGAEFWRVLNRRPEPPVYEPGRSRAPFDRLTVDLKSIAFKDLVREAFCERWPDAVFDPAADWHSRGHCWIGYDKRTEKHIVLFCTREDFSRRLQAAVAAYLEQLPSVDVRVAERYQVRRRHDNEAIDFIGGAPITSLTLSELLDELVDLQDYWEYVRKEVEDRELPNSDLTLQKTYTPARVRIDGREQPEDLSEYIHRWLSADDQRHLAILGEYGEGKSTSALLLTYDLLRRRAIQDRIPILVELRGRSPKNLSAGEILAAWGDRFRLSGRALMILHHAGRLLLIFEGFDEMDGVGEQKTRYAHFASLWQFAAADRAKILLTGRPELFLDDDEIRLNLGVHRAVATGPYTQVLGLCRFDKFQMSDALRNSPREVQQGILQLAGISASFLDVASRPSLLQQVSTIWNTPEFQAHKAEINSAFVLTLFLRSVFRRQAEKVRRDPKLPFMSLNESELAFFSRAVALFMAHQGRQNQISGADLHRAVDKTLETIPIDHQFPARPEVMEDQAPLRQRLLNVPNALEIIVTNVRSYGVLVRDFTGSDLFKFAHKSYYEILCAEQAAHMLTKHGSVELSALARAWPMDLRGALHSPVVVRFCAELLSAAENWPRNEVQQLNGLFDGLFRRGWRRFVPREVCRALILVAPAKIYALLSGLYDAVKHGDEIDREKLMMRMRRRAVLVAGAVGFFGALLSSYALFTVYGIQVEYGGDGKFVEVVDQLRADSWYRMTWLMVALASAIMGIATLSMVHQRSLGPSLRKVIFFALAEYLTSMDGVKRFAGWEFALTMREEAAIAGIR